ncbi:MAG: polysaccharide deacetylase family protein [Myxococcales bacterium]|nr:polysaccharide deacetylase family protein [Myxococcales bacterium]
MKALKLAALCLSIASAACHAEAPQAFLSRVEPPAVARAEVVIESEPVEREPAGLESLRACALGSGDAAPIMDRNDPTTPKRVALTFDDGPHVSFTPGVLRALRTHRLAATFFLVGRSINGQTYPLVQRMVAEGHALAIHSYNHEVEMATRFGRDKSEAYIAGQWEVTRMLIDIALLSTSTKDFDASYTRVFGVAPYAWITEEMLANDVGTFAERHRVYLAERGYEGGARPIEVVFWRPPGGGPYLAHESGEARKTYDRALRAVGAINVIWHGGSGDTDRERRHDRSFLLGNLRHASRAGGVLLLHDPIDKVALDAGLSQLKTDGVEVVSLETLAREKLCPARE